MHFYLAHHFQNFYLAHHFQNFYLIFTNTYLLFIICITYLLGKPIHLLALVLQKWFAWLILNLNIN